MASINASTSGPGGIITSGDTSGNLELQSGGSAIATVSSTGLSLASGKTLSVDGVNISPYAMKNRIINGGMDIAQRGNTFTSTSSANNDDTYVLDRFYILSDGNDAIDVTQTTTASGTYNLDRWICGLSQPSKFSIQQNQGSITQIGRAHV